MSRWGLMKMYPGFLVMGGFFPTNNYVKIGIGKYSNEVRVVYSLYANYSYFYIGYYTASTYANYIYSNTFATYTSNVFDIYNDESNFSVMVVTNGDSYIINRNGVITPYYSLAYTFSNITALLANKSTAVGCNPNVILTHNGTAVSTNLTLGSASVTNSLNVFKSRLPYNNDALLYYISSPSTNTGTTNIQCFNLKTPSTPLLSTPFVTENNTMPFLIESDGSSRLYMIYRNSYYRYNSALKKFEMEYTAANSILMDGLYGFYKAIYIGDNLLLLSASTSNSYVKVYTYNTVTRNFSEASLNVNNPSAIQSGDIYYDTNSFKAYIGLFEYVDTGSYKLYLYANQM